MKEEKVRLLFVCLGNIWSLSVSGGGNEEVGEGCGIGRSDRDRFRPGSPGIMRETGRIHGCGRMRP